MAETERSGEIDAEDGASVATSSPSVLHLKLLRVGVLFFASYWLGTGFTILIAVGNPLDPGLAEVAFTLTMILGFLGPLLCLPLAHRVGRTLSILFVWAVLTFAVVMTDRETIVGGIAVVWGGPIASVLCLRGIGMALGSSTIDRTARAFVLFQLLSLLSCGSLAVMEAGPLVALLLFGAGASWLASLVVLFRLFRGLRAISVEAMGPMAPQLASHD